MGLALASLDEVEASLVDLIGDARRRWQQVAAQLCLVRDGELWRAGGYGSLTAWVTALADRVGYQSSHLWRSLKAADIYAEWTDDAPTEVVGCRPGAEKLELAAKVLPHLGDEDAEQLREQVLADEITLRELREMWGEHRPPRPMPAGPAGGNEAEESAPSERLAVVLDTAAAAQLQDLCTADGMSAADMVAALVAAAWQQRLTPAPPSSPPAAPPVEPAARPVPEAPEPVTPARGTVATPVPDDAPNAAGPGPMVLSDEQADALVLAGGDDRAMFLTGRAGTGKSMILHRLRDEASATTAFLAPTGRAALNIGAATIHSFFGLPIGVLDPAQLRLGVKARERLQGTHRIVIDEISMVRVDVLAAMDHLARQVPVTAGAGSQPFGGRHLAMVGDLHQLPPVVRPDAQDYLAARFGSGSGWCFTGPSWADLDPTLVELTHVFRQADDEFTALLNRIRVGDRYAVDAINEQARHDPAPADVPTLCSTNAAADKVNAVRLGELKGWPRKYHANISGDVDLASMPAPEHLMLKPGAQVVMLTNGKAEHSWVNGSIGTVVACEPDHIAVRFPGHGSTTTITANEWEIETYDYDAAKKALRRRVVGRFSQIPVRLAWGMTAHKAQGMTLDAAQVDLGRGAFAHGQTYVALSRVRSLDRLWLRRPLRPNDVIVDDEVLAFTRSLR